MSHSSDHAIARLNAERNYLEALKALATLGLPLMEVPSGVPATTALRCELLALHVALLKVQIEAIRSISALSA